MTSKKKKFTVAVDLDDTVWDFVSPLLERYNETYNDNVRKEQITDWNIHSFLKPECKSIFAEFGDDDFYSKLRIKPSTKRRLKFINRHANLYFVTACHSATMLNRSKALARELPWFDDSQLVKLNTKQKFRCSYLIDDYIDNCMYSDGESYLVAQPWNNKVSFETVRRYSDLEYHCLPKRVTDVDKALNEVIRDIWRWRRY